MHIYFSGIGGAGIGPLALVAKEAGYEVSGSDKQNNSYIDYLTKHGITDIHIGQTKESIDKVHNRQPIDWFVYSSALPKENPEHPELKYVETNGIKHSKRDEFLNQILSEKNLKLIAIAGTHGKSTTTAMVIWLLTQLGIPASYSVGAKTSYAAMGKFDPKSEYFVYECDEFDRNFLAFNPYISLITGVAWDHHEVFPTFDNYKDAFREFMAQSNRIVMWQNEVASMPVVPKNNYEVLGYEDAQINSIKLDGKYNRQNAWLAVNAVHMVTQEPIDWLIQAVNNFPGISRRMEQIAPNLYSDYAHTPEKIVGGLNTALEIAKPKKQKVVIIYEPLTNRRMHYTKDKHADIFEGADRIYWVPSYLAREDPAQPILTPSELIKSLHPKLQEVAKPMELDQDLKTAIKSHLDNNHMVVAMSGGGGHSLDEWLRKNF